MPPSARGQATLHAVRNEQLREVMSGLRSVSFDRMPQELDDPGRRLREVSSVAASLAGSADRIAAVAADVGLQGNEQEVFLNLTGELRQRALKLQSEADSRQTIRINTTMKEIEETCAACHTLFRDFPQQAPSPTP